MQIESAMIYNMSQRALNTALFTVTPKEKLRLSHGIFKQIRCEHKVKQDERLWKSNSGGTKM